MLALQELGKMNYDAINSRVSNSAAYRSRNSPLKALLADKKIPAAACHRRRDHAASPNEKSSAATVPGVTIRVDQNVSKPRPQQRVMSRALELSITREEKQHENVISRSRKKFR